MIAVCRLLACLFYLFVFGHCDNPLTRLIEEPARGIATTTTTTTARDAASYSCGFSECDAIDGSRCDHQFVRRTIQTMKKKLL